MIRLSSPAVASIWLFGLKAIVLRPILIEGKEEVSQ